LSKPPDQQFYVTRFLVKISLYQFKGSRGFFAIAACFQLESYFLVVVQASQASLLNSRNVDKHVSAAIVRLNEAEAFSWVKPFYGAVSHPFIS